MTKHEHIQINQSALLNEDNYSDLIINNRAAESQSVDTLDRDSLARLSENETDTGAALAQNLIQDSILMRMWKAIVKVIIFIIPPMDAGIWKLEKSMHPWTLRFLDEKIEHAYQWNVNKRYLQSNRLFAWFLLFITVLLTTYHWLVETHPRFYFYFPLNLFMILLTVILISFTYFRYRQNYFIYKHIHRVLAGILFLYSFTWMVGQPLVLHFLYDPLLLDPMHTLLIFFIYNLAITNLYFSMISTSVLVFSQGLVATVGMYVNKEPFDKIFLYVVNDFLSLLLAYIFAYMCARVKEMCMRQIYLVRHFQKEEATILQSSRIKMQIVDDGMRVLRSHKSVEHLEKMTFTRQQRPRVLSLRHFASDNFISRHKPLCHLNSPIHPVARPPLSHVLEIASKHRENGGGSNTTLTHDEYRRIASHSSSNASLVSSWIDIANQPYPEHHQQAIFQGGDIISGTLTPDCETEMNFDLEQQQQQSPFHLRQNSSFAGRVSPDVKSQSSTGLDENIFLSIMHELPNWLFELPYVFQSRQRRHTLWVRIVNFFKYNICMYAGDERLEEDFQKYFNPISLSRFKLLTMSAIVGGIIISWLNIAVGSYTILDISVRLAFIPIVALIVYIVVCFKSISDSPHMTQSVILIGAYLIFVGYLAQVFDSNNNLINIYNQLDPQSTMPSLSFPSNPELEIRYEGLFKSPFDSFNQTSLHQACHSQHNCHVRVQNLMAQLLDAETKFITKLNAMTLFCCFAASSSGMRLVSFMIWKVAVISTLIIAAIISTFYTGFDGQRVRTSIATVTVVLAGAWIVRPLEGEMRKWFHLKSNFGL